MAALALGFYPGSARRGVPRARGRRRARTRPRHAGALHSGDAKLESAALPTIRTVAANPQSSGKLLARAILVLRGERTVDQLFDPGTMGGGGG